MSSPRATRPRFQPADAVWIILLAALSAALSSSVRGATALGTVGTCAAAGTVALSYLLGWRARDRATGVIAGLLPATSVSFLALAADHGAAALFALLTVGALFAFVAGSSLAAVSLAAVAALIRPDALLLALLLLALSLAQHRKRALYGALLLVLIAGGGGTALIVLAHRPPPAPVLGSHLGLMIWAASPATVFLTWFLLPFCAELGEAPRRARWLPVVLWAVLYLAAGSLVQFGDASAALLPFMPLLFVLAAGGLGRLLPTLAGEFPNPALRYLIATLAVLALVGIRARAEWPLRPPVPSPVLSPSIGGRGALLTSPTGPPASPIHTPAPKARAVPQPARPKPVAVPHPAARPAIPLYAVKNGRLVRRSKWAIAWEQAHPRH